MRKTVTQAIVTAIFTVGSWGVGAAAPSALQLRRTIDSESLVAIGAHDAWGTVGTVPGRSGQVAFSVFGLAPRSTYTIEVAGRALADLETDKNGDGSVRLLGSAVVGSEEQPFFKGLEFVVLDRNGAPVLEGRRSGSSDRPPGNVTAYEERAVLRDVNGGGAKGVATIERGEDGKQELRSTAIGLEPGMTCQVLVDGITAAIVTADSSGSASFELEAPDNSNPLPADLQPVESLRLVDWARSNGTPVLSGSFTGVNQRGDDDGDDEDGSWYGLVHSIAADGFELATGNVIYGVNVNTSTVWEDLSGLDALGVNDFVEVEGALNDGVITALRVELKSGDDDDGDDDDDDDDGDDDDGDDDDGDDDDDDGGGN